MTKAKGMSKKEYRDAYKELDEIIHGGRVSGSTLLKALMTSDDLESMYESKFGGVLSDDVARLCEA